MRRLILLVPVVLLLGLSAEAQETPQWELGGGYSNLFADVGGRNFTLYGGGASIQENVTDWFAGRIEVNAYGGDTSGLHLTAQTYTFGPVVSYRKLQRLTPFAHLQLGVIHASAGYLGISESATKFALAPGGGLDFAFNPRVTVRVQGDFLSTYFLNQRQNNAQFSAGLVFRLGHVQR